MHREGQGNRKVMARQSLDEGTLCAQHLHVVARMWINEFVGSFYGNKLKGNSPEGISYEMNKERTNAYKQSVHIARDRYCLHFVFASSPSHATATGARAERNRQVITDSR